MIIYNVTSNIAPDNAANWLTWMKQEHIPEVLATGMFTHFRILHLLEMNEQEGVTYAVQYFASTLENCQHYINVYATPLREKVLLKWGEQIVSFRTIMEIVD